MLLTRDLKPEKLLLFLLGSGSLVFFGFFYPDHLYQKEQLQLFEITFSYFFKMISHHGGLSVYLSEFFIQFFHLPFTGAAIITVMILSLQRITEKIMVTITGKSTLLILSFLPAIGYLILLADNYYLLSGLAGLLISLTGVLFYLRLKESALRSSSGMLLIPSVYWLTGGAYLVFASVIILAELLVRFRKRESGNIVSLKVLACYSLLTVFIPLIARQFLFEDTILQSYISEAYYKIRIFFPLPLIVVFISFPVLILIQALLPDTLSAKKITVINITSVAMSAGIFICGILHFGDFSEESDTAYENMVYKEQWGRIIRHAEKNRPDTRISILSVNLALGETGQLSSKMFQFDQHKNSLFPEYERRGMTPFIASDVFYYLGLFNFSQMFAVETIESTPDAKFPARMFKRAAETYIINGQYDVAMKYLTPLSHTLFYRRWAKDCMSYLYNEEKINSNPFWSSKRSLISKYDFYYNSKQMDLMLRYLLISNSKNRVAFEYLMAYYLLQKNFDGFLENIHMIEDLNYKSFPIVWQEASAYIRTRLSQVPPQLAKFPLSSEVANGIRSYAKLFSSAMQDTVEIKKEFGKTYWYYLHFK